MIKMDTKKSGFTLLISIIITAMLLIVSFVIVNVALKQLLLANAGKESQYAFYAADGGTECAVYWDFPANGAMSHFDPYYVTATNNISCDGDIVVSRPPVVSGYSTTTFQIDFTKGCAIVSVVKKVGAATTTKIDSRGYNTCDVNASRRYERGVFMEY
jgi:hypothetical protein